MNRASLRFWTTTILILMAFTLGYAIGALTTPTTQYETYVEICPPREAKTR